MKFVSRASLLFWFCLASVHAQDPAIDPAAVRWINHLIGTTSRLAVAVRHPKGYGVYSPTLIRDEADRLTLIHDHLLGRLQPRLCLRDGATFLTEKPFTLGYYTIQRVGARSVTNAIIFNIDGPGHAENLTAKQAEERTWAIVKVLEAAELVPVVARSNSASGRQIYVTLAESIETDLAMFIARRIIARVPGAEKTAFFPGVASIPDGQFGQLMNVPLSGAPLAPGGGCLIDRAGHAQPASTVRYISAQTIATWRLALAQASPAAQADKPNVLFIAVDDLNPMLGCYGNGVVKSPNLDQLAAKGLLFRRAYCQTALCMPSRSSLLSGYRPETLGNKAGPLTGNAPAGTISLPQLFRKNGYTTVSLGKIYHHNNDDPEGWTRRGTETFVAEGQWSSGYCSGYQLASNQATVQNYLQGQRTKAGLPASSITEITDTPDEKTPDGLIARRAIEELQQLKKSGEPFFLAAGFYRPHMPLTAPKKYWDLYDRASFALPANFRQPDDGIPRGGWDEVRRYGDCPLTGPMPESKAREIIHGYHASITFVDAQIGKVLAELRRLGLDQNTFVILWSDNGWHLGDHGRWSKPTNYESVTRIALMISGPGIPPNQQTDALVELVDLYPSLSELCRLPPPAYLEGTSFVPLLQSPQRPWKTAAFSCMLDYTTRSVRTDRYRFIARASGRNELYDCRDDPAEDRNLVNDPAAQQTLAEMQATLNAGWRGAAPKR